MLLVGNWKAYVDTREEAKALLSSAKRLAKKSRKVKLVLAPPAPFLAFIASDLRAGVAFAGQDISRVDASAATGEVSGAALYGAGARYVIVGHSERRAFGETDALVAEKVKRALTAGLVPVVCVGEAERDADAVYLRSIRAQLAAVYASLAPAERTKVVIAYEPIWAIGRRAEEAITPHDLTEMVLYIRKVLGEYLPGTAAAKALVLYGGSVDQTNVKELQHTGGVNGFLVGRASADPSTFAGLVRALLSA